MPNRHTHAYLLTVPFHLSQLWPVRAVRYIGIQ